MAANNKEYLDKMLNDILSLSDPKIDVKRREQILRLIDSTINGDTVEIHLVINASLKEDKKGTITYVLTNLRLIKIDIDANEIESVSFPLDTLIGIERKLIDDDRAQFQISFQNGSFGLRYSSSNNEITDFFQRVDQARMKGIR